MNLRKKKELAAKTLNVGKKRIIFVKSRLDEIKDAITKQDIRDLHSGEAILIRQISGRKIVSKKGKRRSTGNTRKKIRNNKQKYVLLTRKLRKHLNEEVNKNRNIPKEQIYKIKKKIKNREFKNKSNFNEYLKSLNI